MAVWIASDECELDETDMGNVARSPAADAVDGLAVTQPHDCASSGQRNHKPTRVSTGAGPAARITDFVNIGRFGLLLSGKFLG